MKVRIHKPHEIAWRRIGEIAPADLRPRLDPSELDCEIGFHERGGAHEPQLMELRLKPHALAAPHSHDGPEVFYVLQGAVHIGAEALEPGASFAVTAGCPYSYRAGPDGARLLEFRPTADPSFHPRG